MKLKESAALIEMRSIIEGFLDGRYDSRKTVEKLIRTVDLDVICAINTDMMTTDCYYSIKHLTETGYETTKVELAYLKDCIDGIREYDVNEKIELTRKWYKDNMA